MTSSFLFLFDCNASISDNEIVKTEVIKMNEDYRTS